MVENVQFHVKFYLKITTILFIKSIISNTDINNKQNNV